MSSSIGVSDAARLAMAQRCAQAVSRQIGPERTPECPMVVFYRLGRKFVDDERSVPKEASDVIYYTLAVGHHTGVIDCFDEALSCPVEVFERAVALLPEGEPARYKLEGILRSGEIQVDKTSAPMLAQAVSGVLGQAGEDGAEETALLRRFADELALIERDPVVYLMGRARLP